MLKSNIVLIMLILSFFSGTSDFSDTLLSKPSSIQSESTTIENEETIAFNKDLKLYVGNNLSGSQVKTLINMIQTSNTTNPDKQIALLINSVDYITTDDFLEAINDINLTASYTVHFEYSPSGFINKSVIQQNITVTPTPSITPSPTTSSTPAPTTSGEIPSIESTAEPTPSITPTATPTPTPMQGNVSTTVTF